jgi:hypothetical protein
MARFERLTMYMRCDIQSLSDKRFPQSPDGLTLLSVLPVLGCYRR